jgi:oxalate decarboxylase/phosphoglucose isomerase-like protein (cupin superfamily)
MKVYNIYKNSEAGLSSFSDSRGSITDIFFKKSINHGCIITNEPGAIRGNHYHNHTTQYTYVLLGTLTYYSSKVGSDVIEKYEAIAGDMIISEPREIHAMKTNGDGCTFIAFAEGPRGGADYETDTVRVDSIIYD